MTSTYLLVNTSNNIVENAVLWDGNTETWQPPSGYLTLELDSTISVEWEWSAEANDWLPVDVVGAGAIGELWDGQKLISPKPEAPVVAVPLDPVNPDTGPSVIE